MGSRFSFIQPRKYGWRRDIKHNTDKILMFDVQHNQHIVSKVDLRQQYHALIYDQGSLGSCTANALSAAFLFDEMKQKSSLIYPSRLFIYYNERSLEGTVDTDSGATLRDGMKTLKNVGTCSEKLWPYDESKIFESPAIECYDQAAGNKIIEYSRISRDLEQFKQCLLEGLPFVFGIDVYESFESKHAANTGFISMPEEGEELLGGHALLCVGFDDANDMFIFQNSWGEKWGDNGFGYLPYKYLLDEELSDDFWVMKRVNTEVVAGAHEIEEVCQ